MNNEKQKQVKKPSSRHFQKQGHGKSFGKQKSPFSAKARQEGKGFSKNKSKGESKQAACASYVARSSFPAKKEREKEQEQDTSIQLISRRAPAQKYANFEEYLKSRISGDQNQHV